MKQATQDNTRKVIAFRSSSGSAVYETVIWKDGTHSCNCPGWVLKRKDKPRHCKHIDMIAGRRPMENRFDIGEYINETAVTRAVTRHEPVRGRVIERRVTRHIERDKGE